MSQMLEKVLTAPRVESRECAVFLLDLDRFKQVNDTMGHPAGDALLKQVAQRLQSTVGDAGRVGRLGGDEFKVVIPGRTERAKLADLAQRIIDNLSQPYSIDGARVVIGASIGIAVAPDDGVTSEAIIRNADLALYAAKDRGRGVYHFYDADLHSDAEERRQEHDLRDALNSGGLELHYQPVVHLATRRITGFEALLRWNHPKLGRMSPAKFVPIAEEAGLIAQIGEWALRTACHQLAAWPDHVRVAVNVAAAICQPVAARHRYPRAGLGRGGAFAAGAGNHRKRVSGRWRCHGGDVLGAEARGGAPGARRFRHGLFQPRLSEEGALRQDQDRPGLCARRHRARQPQRGDHRLDRQPGRGAGHGNHRRGRGNAGRAGTGDRAEMQPCAGLCVRQAAAAR
jgi:diguanylate cyclase (GGDEF)-like protein